MPILATVLDLREYREFIRQNVHIKKQKCPSVALSFVTKTRKTDHTNEELFRMTSLTYLREEINLRQKMLFSHLSSLLFLRPIT